MCDKEMCIITFNISSIQYTSEVKTDAVLGVLENYRKIANSFESLSDFRKCAAKWKHI